MKAFGVLLVISLGCTATDDENIQVSGKLVGYDGKPMNAAHVHLVEANSQKPQKSVAVGTDGSFHLAGVGGAVTYIEFTGVNHLSQRYFVLGDKPVKLTLDVRLRAYPYLPEFEEVRVIGDFEGFNPSTSKKMERQADGTYTVEIETKEDKFNYQISGITPPAHSVSGTQSEEYEYDNGGEYRSIVTPIEGKVKIIFDPQKLIRSNNEHYFYVVDDALMTSYFAIQADLQQRRRAFTNAVLTHQAEGKDPREFSFDVSPYVTKLAAAIQEENEPLPRKMLLASYMSLVGHGAQTLDTTLAKRALEEIEFSSPLWSIIHPLGFEITVDRAGLKDRYEEFLDRFLAENPERNAKAVHIFSEARNAKYTNDAERFQRYYDLLMSDYADTRWAKSAKVQLLQEEQLTLNTPAPSFSVVSMEEPNVKYSNESLKGSYYLVDFWAVWCGPCVAEMDNLHEVYNKYKNRNFHILSLSFDRIPEDVMNFRKNKWKMPWLHSFVGEKYESAVAKAFNVSSVPKPVLVDPDGNIVALEVELRGANLDKTLSRLLNEN